MLLSQKQILLIVGGGIAAYKTPELVRALQKQGARVRCVLTKAGSQFVTPMTLSALTNEPVCDDLFDPKTESQFGHIRLAREAELIVVAPATANLLAKSAQGIADDLASTILLASDAPVLFAPAMNAVMWDNPATQENIKKLEARKNTLVLAPDSGQLACGEEGAGRLPEPQQIADVATACLAQQGRLAGKTALVTAGATQEPIDPVRFLSNASSGKQGFAIATALAQAGAKVQLIAGATDLTAPSAVQCQYVRTAEEMRQASLAQLPCDIAVLTAAVADWRIAKPATQKIKKNKQNRPPILALEETPDILAELSQHKNRPALVVGFAAETTELEKHAKAKLARKGCDWIVANDIAPATGVLGGDNNQFHIISPAGVEHCPPASKWACANMLTQRIITHFAS